MFLVGIFQWWYSDGLVKHVKQQYLGILRTADYFSIGLLMQTLFNPFRQISAGYVDGPLPIKIRAFFDRLFSRIVGAVVRTMVIVAGIIMIMMRLVWVAVGIVVWLVLPVSPILGVILWQLGVAL